MRNLELGDTLALGYGVRRVLVQAEPVDVEVVKVATEILKPMEKQLDMEKESEKKATDGDDKITQSKISINPPNPINPEGLTSVQESQESEKQRLSVGNGPSSIHPGPSSEPKEQLSYLGNGSSFTHLATSSQPRTWNKKSYKIADDPRGTPDSQKRLQSLLNAARAEADGYHTPNTVAPLRKNDGAKDVEDTRQTLMGSTELDQQPFLQYTGATSSQDLRSGPSDYVSNTTVADDIQKRNMMGNEMDVDTPTILPQLKSNTTGRSIPKVGYQYQSAPTKKPREDVAQLSVSPAGNDVGGIDYFSRHFTHPPVSGQRKRGRPKASGVRPAISREEEEASSPKDPASMSFSSLAEVEQFSTPKPAPKKRGRPRGPTIKHKAPVEVPQLEVPSEETGDTGLHITESGLRSSRRRPKPRQFFTPTQTASPEPEPELKTTTTGKYTDPATPSKPPRKYRELIYTSYEDILREEDDQKRKAGIDGVYINPLDAREGRSLARKKTLVVLIKSQKLRDPDFLENQKGTWIEVLAEKRKALHDAVEAKAAKIAATTSQETKSNLKRKRNEGSEAEGLKRPKPLDGSSENSSEVPSVESTNSSDSSVPGRADVLKVPNAGTAKQPEIQGIKPQESLEILSPEATESSDTADSDTARPSHVPIVGSEILPDVPHNATTEHSHPEIVGLENSLETSIVEPVKSLESQNVASSRPSEAVSPRPDSFPSNEGLALDFEKFKALSAGESSAIPSTKPHAFPSNEELAREFEKFKAGFAQEPSQKSILELPKSSRPMIDPFEANSMQYGQQAATCSDQRASVSTPNIQSPAPSSSFHTNYMNSMRARSPQTHFSHQVSQYDSPSHITRYPGPSLQNNPHAAAASQPRSPRSPRWSGSLEPNSTVQNSLPQVANMHPYNSPYRALSEHSQAAGRHYQPPVHGISPAMSPQPAGDSYNGIYESKQQATPLILTANPWLARNQAHFHQPDHQPFAHQSPIQQSPLQLSPAQNSWPAGFLPPEPPKLQVRPKTEWPAGFLPPDPLPSGVGSSTPMSIDSIQQSSPFSASHASKSSTIAHTSQENVSTRASPHASSPLMRNSEVAQDHPAPPIAYNSSPYSRPVIPATKPQLPGSMGRQNDSEKSQVPSPLGQKLDSDSSAVHTQNAVPAESGVELSKPGNERQFQALLPNSAQAPSFPVRSIIPTQPVKRKQADPVSTRTHSPKMVASQGDQNPLNFPTPAQIDLSKSVKPILEPALQPAAETEKRKSSVLEVEPNATPQFPTATVSKPIPTPEVSALVHSKPSASSSVAVETTRPATPIVTTNDVEAFKKAEGLEFEPYFARMSCIYNSSIGNLILSFDKTQVKFFSMAEGNTDPIWTMQVWKMAENPIVSMPGSNPMELRLKERKDDESIVLHRFLIAKSKEANKSANEMRANLVTARIFVQMANPQIVQAEDPEVIAAKPWKCEKCGARFKNKEGIKYHLSKSQTTCNPDFKPESVKPRRYGPQMKEKPKKAKATKTNGKVATPPEQEVQPEPSDESSSEGGDSDDSVFEWAAKVASLKKSPMKGRVDRGEPVIGRGGKVYKSLGGERPALLEIVETVQKTPSLKEELAKIPSLPQIPGHFLPEAVLPMSKEKVVKDIILCLLQANNNNTLPGERGLWFAFVACWLKYYPTSKVLPEHKLFSRALDELLEDGILSKISFDFPGAKSRTITRSVLFDPKLPSPSPNDIAKLKEETKSKHPDFYIPLAFTPPGIILVILIGIGKPSPQNSAPAPEISAVQLNDILGSEEEAGKDDSSDDDFKPEIHALDAEDDLEDDPMDLDIDSDEVGSGVSPFPDHNTPHSLQIPPLHQQKTSMVKTRIKRPGQALTLEERDRRKRMAAQQEQMWSPPPAPIQNSENGAWDTLSKPKRAYKLKERFPEPSTFMQDSSGSWSVRPFGHGVNPIFARPNKIAVGNPQGQHYLQQREDGHRPVIHPNKSIMRPSVPSKFFLKKNLQGNLVTRPDGQVEVSKNTGLPKRHYTYRTRSQKDPEISRYTGLKKRAYRSLTPDPMDLMEASANGMTELDILNHYEAKPLEKEVGRQSNPGLASIPNIPATPNLPHLFVNESAGLWDHAHPFHPCTNVEKLKMHWLDRTAFALETIPYSALEDNDDLPPEQQTLIGPNPKRRKQQKKEPHIGVRKGLKNKWVMARRLTSAPDDLLGVHRDVRYAADLLGTQMVNYDTNIRRKRQRFKEQGLAIDEEERLTMGIVVIRTMLGGLEMNIDWVILGSVFKDYSLNFLRKWWQVVWAKKKPMVEKLTKGFQQVFIMGYRKGQVQSIDYDHVTDYDFNTLIDWAMTKINTPTVEEKVFDLPSTFSELKEKYALVPEPRSNQWSEQYYYPLAAVYQRMNLVNSVPFSSPLHPETPNYEIDDYALAKSWCRAAAVTPDHLWDSKAANKVLNRLPSSIIIKAREDLLKNKIITKNKRLRTNGRVYNLPDAFNAIFVRTGKVIYEKQYREAYYFKCELDRRFQNGEVMVNIPWGVDEGSVLAITNLQAIGCIHVQKSNIRANKFGLTEGGYETRLIDKSKYRFQMDITPTSTYVYNHSIPNLDTISDPPPLGPRGAIPVWRSITGEVIEGMWRKVLLGITGAFVLRSSIDIEGLERVFAPSLDKWEIKRLIEWGVKKGVWRKCDYEGLGAKKEELNELEGWKVGDWWWVIVGRYLVEGKM